MRQRCGLRGLRIAGENLRGDCLVLGAFDLGIERRGHAMQAQLRDQGAMTQLYALLAWNSSDYPKLT